MCQTEKGVLWRWGGGEWVLCAGSGTARGGGGFLPCRGNICHSSARQIVLFWKFLNPELCVLLNYV